MGVCYTRIAPDTEFGERNNGRIQKRRQCIGVCFLYFMVALVAILMGYMIYISATGDVNQVLHGHDDCGNACGEQNKPIENYPSCFGVDMTSKPFLLDRIETFGTGVDPKRKRSCVENCEKYGYQNLYGRCVPKNTDEVSVEPGQHFSENDALLKMKIFYMSLIPLCNVYCFLANLALVALTVMLLRYNTESFIWPFLIGGTVALILVCIGIWAAAETATTIQSKQMFMQVAIVPTVFTGILSLCLLVIEIYKHFLF